MQPRSETRGKKKKRSIHVCYVVAILLGRVVLAGLRVGWAIGDNFSGPHTTKTGQVDKIIWAEERASPGP